MTQLMKKFTHFLTTFGSYCPYTIAGKKVVKYAKNTSKNHAKSNKKNFNKNSYKQISKQSNTQIEERKNILITRIKTGRNIVLIGVFCPFFWYAFFTGIRGSELYWNLIHSSIVIVGGLIYMYVNRRALHNINK